MLKPNRLSFAKGNAKLKGDTATLSLPAGHTCPCALECLAKADRETGKLTDGPDAKIRCYAATAENLFRVVRTSRWHNFELLRGKSIPEMVLLINNSLPRKGIKLVRIHASGDFFSQAYFDAWLIVAIMNPNLIFYGYTKALDYWIARLPIMPANFRLVASLGGRLDHLAKPNGLRTALIVWKESDAGTLPIDHDDSHCWNYSGDFAILLHNTQRAESDAGKAWHQIKTKGRGGYKSDYFAHYKK
jgi:hypothetical protein